MNRRRLLHSLALTGSGATLASGQSGSASIEALRNVAVAHGVKLSEERLGVLQGTLDQRKARIQQVREFEIDDSIEPGNGCF